VSSPDPSRPLSEAEHATYADAQQRVEFGRVPIVVDPTSQRMFFVSFDGTWNDRAEMAIPTNAAVLQNLVERTIVPGDRSMYIQGVGIAGPLDRAVGGALGAGVQARVEEAYREYVAWANQILEKDPDALLSLNIAGFSRGATAARIFANLVHEKGIPDASTAYHSRSRAASGREVEPGPKVTIAGRGLRAYSFAEAKGGAVIAGRERPVS
jgi:hypothetical protein